MAPDESKTGSLANGAFSYDCINTQDPYCPDPQTLTQPFPPAIAVGGRFSLAYTPSKPTRFPNVAVQAVSSDFFIYQGNVFGALRAGTPSFVAANPDGTIVDFTSVTVQPIVAIQIADAQPGSATVAGTTHSFGAIAQGALAQNLAGEVLYEWTASDPTILSIQTPSGLPTPSSSVTVTLLAKGAATLTASTSSVRASVKITVAP